MPLASAFEGGRSSMTLPKGELRETSGPNLRLNVLADSIFPFVRYVFDTSLPIRTFPDEMDQLDTTKRTLTREAMKCALVKCSQGTG